MTKAEKLYASLSGRQKHEVFSLMDNNCPSDYGMKDECNEEECDCFKCWNMDLDEVIRDDEGCTGCAFVETEEWDMPCAKCSRNCKDYWRCNLK